MTDSWYVNANRKIHGPYSLARMKAFIAEERMSRGTLVRSGASGGFVEAALHGALARSFDQILPMAAARADSPEASPNDRAGHFVLVLELKSGSSVKVEDALKHLGKFYRVNHSVWLLQSEMPLANVQSAIAPALGSTDTLLIVESVRAKFATYNFGPQAAASIKTLWG